MSRLLILLAAVGFQFAAMMTVSGMSPASINDQTASPLPEFTNKRASHWVNGPPLSVNDLRGAVVLIDVWTFDCWNCYRSFPWLHQIEEKFSAQGLRVIGIHTPEFSHEKNLSAVRRKVREFGLRHPVMIDNDMRYWKALDNRYWPAFYLVDRQGQIQHRFIGETAIDSDNAKRIETAITALLEEKPAQKP